MPKRKGCGTTFLKLGRRGGGAEEGVEVFWRVGKYKTWYSLSLSMISDCKWGFE